MKPRQQWLLLFLGADGGSYKVDQVRAMKGLFLLSKEPGHPASALYSFDPYDYGPFDSTVYRDLDALQEDGLVKVTQHLGSRKRDFELTERGKAAFEALKRQTSSEAYEPVAAVKRHVTSLGFSALLADIYGRFSEYRDRSIAPEARATG